MAQSTGKRRVSVGVLFWIAFILLVLVIFLANRSNIQQVLETTGIVDVIRDRVADEPGQDAVDTAPEGAAGDTAPGDTPSTDQPSPRVTTTNQNNPASDDSVVFDTSPDPGSATSQESETVSDPSTATGSPDATASDREEEPAADDQTRDGPDQEPQDVTRPNQRMAALYFIRVTDDGRTYPQRVVRSVAYADSPLTETIRALIAGPTGNELTEGLLNLIPSGTELISAHVANGVAYLNFNRSFRFNPMGAEGTVAQLQQIIYSSTEFPTVTRVQFLIEGERLDYVGGDGIYIGEPLGRDAFS